MRSFRLCMTIVPIQLYTFVPASVPCIQEHQKCKKFFSFQTTTLLHTPTRSYTECFCSFEVCLRVWWLHVWAWSCKKSWNNFAMFLTDAFCALMKTLWRCFLRSAIYKMFKTFLGDEIHLTLHIHLGFSDFEEREINN